MPEASVRDIIEIAGVGSAVGRTAAISTLSTPAASDESVGLADQPFSLPGRSELESFINEHVVDIIREPLRYQTLGIGFPSGIVLHGPPGSGKTFAVEKLTEYLGWPVFKIEASTIASPYIHETSHKVSSVFEHAIKHAPSVLIIDEMEAFLASRELGGEVNHHRLEELSEFLRRIPEAVSSRVLVLATTNRIDLVDPAILRRGRFDHVVEVANATRQEVLHLLQALLKDIPREDDIECEHFANELAGRPLSDVAYTVREAARLAARRERSSIDFQSMTDALHSVGARPEKGRQAIGFRLQRS
jgi:SpoVK/Ycf46/Vps4 family AAA+-type ATPase